MEDGLSIIGGLRDLIPRRACRFDESLRVAELQATRLLNYLHIEHAPVPSEVVSELPRISVEYRSLPMSGVSYWNGHVWIVGINRAEPSTRQRFTLLHEFKHIIDHGRVGSLYPGSANRSPEQQAEQAADYFAGCALMPRTLMKRAWASGMQTPAALARHFETSERAVQVRLTQIGLLDQTTRHGGTMPYRRDAHPNYVKEVA